jgi:hypothetical protein
MSGFPPKADLNSAISVFGLPMTAFAQEADISTTEAEFRFMTRTGFHVELTSIGRCRPKQTFFAQLLWEYRPSASRVAVTS